MGTTELRVKKLCATSDYGCGTGSAAHRMAVASAQGNAATKRPRSSRIGSVVLGSFGAKAARADTVDPAKGAPFKHHDRRNDKPEQIIRSDVWLPS
eukprot:6188379-Pleurochrysis_carterae.AAC.4